MYSFIKFCVFGIIAVANIVTAAEVQNGNDPCGCDAILIDGVYAYRANRGDEEAKHDVVWSLSHQTYDEFKTALSAGGGASYLAYGFNASMSKEQFEAHRSSIILKYGNVGSKKSSKELLEKYGDKEVIQAWLDCKSRCNYSGVQATIKMLDENNFDLSLEFKSNKEAPFPVVKNSFIEGASVNGKQTTKILEENTIINRFAKKFIVKRQKGSSPIVINIQFDNTDSISLFIPPHIPALPPQPNKEILVSAKELDGRITGYVVNNDANYPGLVTHASAHAAESTPDNAGFTVRIPRSGRYTLFVNYASDKVRPTDVFINNQLKLPGRLDRVTGGLQAADAQWFAEGSLDLFEGNTAINFFRQNLGNIPHIKEFKLIYFDQNNK